MTGAQIKSEMQKTDARLADLEPERDRLQQARKALLISESDHDRATVSTIEKGLRAGDMITVRSPEARQLLEGWSGSGLRAIEADIAELRERRGLLEEQLPSAEEVAEAEREAAGLVKQATEQSEQFEQSWSAFMAALAEAEAASRQVVAIRSEAQTAIRELSQLREQYALDVEIPREPRPDPAESKVAGVTGLLLRDVGYSQVIERQLDAELASARRQLEREAA